MRTINRISSPTWRNRPACLVRPPTGIATLESVPYQDMFFFRSPHTRDERSGPGTMLRVLTQRESHSVPWDRCGCHSPWVWLRNAKNSGLQQAEDAGSIGNQVPRLR